MRLIDADNFDCLTWQDDEHGTTFDDGVLWVLSKIDDTPTIVPLDSESCAEEDILREIDEDLDTVLDDAPPEKKHTKGVWFWRLAENGWADWICSNCGWTENVDIHVTLDYKFCPYCGDDKRRKTK